MTRSNPNKLILLALMTYMVTIALNTPPLLQDANAANSGVITTNVTINNQPPNITSSIRCCFKDSDTPSYNPADCRDEGSSTPYYPSGGKMTDLMCNVTISDPNGYQDIGTGWVNMTWFRNNVTWNSPVHNNTLYINSSCANMSSTGSGQSLTFECGIYSFKYWADAGTWNTLINYSDGKTPGPPHIGDFQIGNMTSLWQGSAIPFGTLGLGENGSENHLNMVWVPSTTNNTGNVILNLQAQGGADWMNCTVGAIPINYINYDLTQGTNINSACGTLSNAAAWTSCMAFQLPNCHDTCANLLSLKNTYWGIRIPTTGVGGSCTRTITVIASN